MRNRTYLPFLQTTFYILAAIILLFGLVVGISLLASSGGVQNALLPFEYLGGEAIVNLISPYITSLLSGLGVAILVVSIVLSLLLFALGRLLGQNLSLEARLRRLEEASSAR